jgi:hypothetical protein
VAHAVRAMMGVSGDACLILARLAGPSRSGIPKSAITT